VSRPIYPILTGRYGRRYPHNGPSDSVAARDVDAPDYGGGRLRRCAGGVWRGKRKAKQIPVEIGPSDGLFVEVRRQRKSATPAVWVPLDATERFVEKAAGLFDGRPVSSLSDGESGR
jgi:hypothetical protein